MSLLCRPITFVFPTCVGVNRAAELEAVRIERIPHVRGGEPSMACLPP